MSSILALYYTSCWTVSKIAEKIMMLIEFLSQVIKYDCYGNTYKLQLLNNWIIDELNDVFFVDDCMTATQYLKTQRGIKCFHKLVNIQRPSIIPSVWLISVPLSQY